MSEEPLIKIQRHSTSKDVLLSIDEAYALVRDNYKGVIPFNPDDISKQIKEIHKKKISPAGIVKIKDIFINILTQSTFEKRTKANVNLPEESKEKNIEAIKKKYESAFSMQSIVRNSEKFIIHIALDYFHLTGEDTVVHYLFSEEDFRNSQNAKNAIVQTFKQAGHFIEQKLKYEYPPDLLRNTQLSLFEQLLPETQDEIKANTSQTITVEGIRLTTAQDRFFNTAIQLLHEKTENHLQDPKNPSLGNLEPINVPYGGKEEGTKAMRLEITIHEFCKKYSGTSYYSGKELDNIKAIAQQLAETKFLIRYKRTYKEEGTGRIMEQFIEEVQSLLRFINLYEIEKGKKKKENEKMVIIFNPLITDQILAKYIEYPLDIDRRMAIAAGGTKKVTEAMNKLRDMVLFERSNRRRSFEIDYDRLQYKLGLEKHVKQNRKKLIRTIINTTIEAIKAVGLISGHSFEIGAKGQAKVKFDVVLDFKKLPYFNAEK